MIVLFHVRIGCNRFVNGLGERFFLAAVLQAQRFDLIEGPFNVQSGRAHAYEVRFSIVKAQTVLGFVLQVGDVRAVSLFHFSHDAAQQRGRSFDPFHRIRGCF